MMRAEHEAARAKRAIVFGCDNAFGPLALGLVHSLKAIGYPDDSTDLVFIKIDEAGSLCDQLTALGVKIFEFSNEYFSSDLLRVIKSYQKAQIVRPHLPKLLPGYESFLWLDSDTWVQDRESISLAFDGIKSFPEHCFAASYLDAGYFLFYGDMTSILAMQQRWYLGCMPRELAESLSKKIHFSSGVVAMASDSEVWKVWADHIERAFFSIAHNDPPCLHLAEQIAFNYAMYSTGKFKVLNSRHNLHCDHTLARRDAISSVVVNQFTWPPEKVGIVHLAQFKKFCKRYIDDGLLFDCGKYLTSEQLNQLQLLASSQD